MSALPAIPAPLLLVNPRGFSASHGLAERAIALAQAEGADVVPARGLDEINNAVDGVLANRQGRVMVLAGDGTVQAVVDRLAHLPHGSWLPDLVVLPGGRTNMTALDLTGTDGALPAMKRALQRSRGGSWDAAVFERAVVRIEQAPAPARHGFFVAGALVDGIIRHVHTYRTGGTGALRRGPLSTPIALVGLAARAVVGKHGMPLPEVELQAEGLGRIHGKLRILLASSLAHSTGSFNPYADRGAGDLRVTAIARSAPRFWRSLPAVLGGRYSPAMDAEAGYLSGRCDRLEATGLPGYMLDGEPFDLDARRPVVISAGPRLRFVRP